MKGARLWWLTADLADDLSRQVTHLDIAVLGGTPNDVEGGRGAAALLGHDDPGSLIDDRAGGQRLVQVF